MRIRVRKLDLPSPEKTGRGRRRTKPSPVTVFLLPVEEDSRFFQRHEEDPVRVNLRFDVIRNFILCLVNTGDKPLMIREEKKIGPAELYVLEKYPFRKFEWVSRYRIPIRIGEMSYLLRFEVPNHLPGEEDYVPISAEDKRAFRLFSRLEKRKSSNR